MPKSLALLHYPYLVYRGGEKRVWDPVRRQTLKIRPEERVRQRIINCLIEESIYPKGRISSESGLTTEDSEIQRTDILCYDPAFNPHLLVECKAENVKITEEAAIQVARYNQQIGAPMLLLSNGVKDYWYEVGKNASKALKTPPDTFDLSPSKSLPASYWKDRGFLGESTSDAANNQLADILTEYWISEENNQSSIRYLSFNQHPDHIQLDQYYRITQHQEHSHSRIALAFIKSREGDSHLVGIINQEKENIGFIDINLTFLNQQKPKNMWVYSANHQSSYNTEKILDINLTKRDWFESLPERIANWFLE